MISTLDTSRILGSPEIMSLPLASIVTITSSPFSSTSRQAVPMLIFSSSAVFSPIRSACLFLIYWIIASLNLSPAFLIEVLTTIPPRAMIAISVVPPPISAIIHAVELSTSRPAPIAAAIGSSRT